VIASPCNRVCRIDPASGLCLGCARTLEEIGRWSAMSNEEQAALVRELPGRRAALAEAAEPRDGDTHQA
jgi:predicted Fe-S protein YdhL (DUF1289 family)